MYQLKVTHTKDYSFEVVTKDAEFVIDAKGGALTPLDALLAGLGSCVGVYIRKYAEGSKLTLDNFTVSVQAELAKESPIAFRLIKIAIVFKEPLDERRKNALLSFVKNCPVHNTLKGNPIIEISLN